MPQLNESPQSDAEFDVLVAKWRRCTRDDSDEVKRQILELGPTAIPLILKEIYGSSNFSLRDILAEFGEDAVEPLCEELKKLSKRPSDASRRNAVITALGKIGDVRAVDPLLSMLGHKSPSARFCSAEALGRIGNRCAVVPLVGALNDGDRDVRAKASQALIEIADPKIADHLLPLLHHEKSYARIAAANLFVTFNDVRAVDGLLQMTGSEKASGREVAARALGAIGDRKALETLVALLSDRHQVVRQAAGYAIYQIDKELGLGKLLDLLDHKKEKFRISAVSALKETGDTRALDKLLNKLSDPSPKVRSEVVWAVGSIGGERTLVHLIRACGDTDEKVRSRAYNSLRWSEHPPEELMTRALLLFGPEDPRPILKDIGWSRQIGGPIIMQTKFGNIKLPVSLKGGVDLIEILEDAVRNNHDKIVRQNAFSLLVEMRYPFDATELIVRLASDDWISRHHARRGIENLGQTVSGFVADYIISDEFDQGMKGVVSKIALYRDVHEDLIENLAAAWDDATPSVRSRIMDLVENSGSQRVKGLSERVLADNLNDKDQRLHAVEILERYGDAEKLIQALANPREDVHREAIIALGRLRDERAIDPLIPFLSSPRAAMRRNAVIALGSIGGQGVVKPLIEMLDDENGIVMSAAAKVLSDVGGFQIASALGKKLCESDLDSCRVLVSQIGKVRADDLMRNYLLAYPTVAHDRLGSLDIITRGLKLFTSRKVVDRALEQQYYKRMDDIKQKIYDIAEAISEKLCTVLGLKDDPRTYTSTVDGYGLSRVGQGMNLVQRTDLYQKLTTRIGDAVEIDEGETIESAMERMRTLNFLVHHQVAYFVQQQRDIPEPAVDVLSAKYLDYEEAKAQGNKVLLDKLALQMARTIYVHGDGDVLFSEYIRESIAIDAHIALGGVVLRNHQNETHKITDENLARMIAVMREMAKSDAVAEKTRQKLSHLADEFYDAMDGIEDEDCRREFDTLINAYRKIFKQTKLKI
jgi:HEAT repeat protein